MAANWSQAWSTATAGKVSISRLVASVRAELLLGNVGTRRETGDVILYDAGSYYAHNEMELGIWKCQWGQYFREQVYSRSYLRNYEAAEPAQEWDDRNRLYSLKYNLNYSGGHPGNITRQTWVRFRVLDRIDEANRRVWQCIQWHVLPLWKICASGGSWQIRQWKGSLGHWGTYTGSYMSWCHVVNIRDILVL